MNSRYEIKRENKMKIILSEARFQQEVLESPQPVLAEFGADWCGASHMLTPILEQLRAEFKGQIQIVRVNIERCPRVAAKYGVRDIPTLAFFKHGQLLDQIIGLAPRQRIANKLHALLHQ